jgi:hypothetical protein
LDGQQHAVEVVMMVVEPTKKQNKQSETKEKNTEQNQLLQFSHQFRRSHFGTT